MKANKSRPATKEDIQELRTELHTEINALETRIDIKLEKLDMRIDDKAKEYRDAVLTGLDKVMKELEIAREERIITNYQIREALKKLTNHEERITVIENQHATE